MHILVATDGTIDPERVAEAVGRWHTEGDQITVFTAMNVPTDFLDHLGDPGIKKAASVALEAGQGFTAGDRAAERLATSRSAHSEAKVDSPVMRSLAAGAAKRTAPVVAALQERSIAAEAAWTTTNNRTARTIMTAIRRYDSGLVVIGSHGHGRFEGLLGSTGTKLVRHSPASVLMIRTSERD